MTSKETPINYINLPSKEAILSLLGAAIASHAIAGSNHAYSARKCQKHAPADGE